MTEQKIVPAILIGGAGTRLWPLSRANLPKQFLPLIGQNSLFQDTVLRFETARFTKPWLLTNAGTVEHALTQLAALDRSAAAVVVEPSMRGTAAALAALALLVAEREADALVLAAPADHSITRPEAFREAVDRAIPFAADGQIITFGVGPTAPETGFGYIRRGEPVRRDSDPLVFYIRAGDFLEKPSRANAEKFVANGYFWNAGIFLFKASALVEQFAALAPDTLAAVRGAVGGKTVSQSSETTFFHLDRAAFSQAPADLSIDNAIMEKTTAAAVVACSDLGWSDVGSLSALWDLASERPESNVVKGDALLMETSGSLIVSRSGRKVVAAHLSDIMIVDTDDCVLVLPRSAAQTVKTIALHLQHERSPLTSYTRAANFAWGNARLTGRIEGASTCEVHIRAAMGIGPRKVLADSEHWVVASGTLSASVDRDMQSIGPGGALSVREGDLVEFSAADAPVSCMVIMGGSESADLESTFRGIGPIHAAEVQSDERENLSLVEASPAECRRTSGVELTRAPP